MAPRRPVLDKETEEALWAAAEWPDAADGAGHDSDAEILSQQPLAKRLKMTPLPEPPPDAQVKLPEEARLLRVQLGMKGYISNKTEDTPFVCQHRASADNGSCRRRELQASWAACPRCPCTSAS